MELIEVASVKISQDKEGRFSLNDLHRAAGGEKRHQPSDWLRLQQTKDLITELATIPGIPGIESKQGLGTFAPKELVYAYAMWISPAFHLKVIRAYDSLVATTKTKVALPDFKNPIIAARAWADAEEKRLIAEKQLEEQKPAVEFHERYVNADNTKCLSDVAKILGIKPHTFNKILNSDSVLFKRDGIWIPYQPHIDAGYFEVKTYTNYGKVFNQTRITPKGITWLAGRYGTTASRAALPISVSV